MDNDILTIEHLEWVSAKCNIDIEIVKKVLLADIEYLDFILSQLNN